MRLVCHTGAVVGGIIGGLAVLAALTAVVALLVLRQRRRNRSGSSLFGKAMSGDEKVRAHCKAHGKLSKRHAKADSSYGLLACDACAPAH